MDMKGWHSRSMLMACTAMAVLHGALPALAQDSGAASGSTVLGTIEVKGKKAAAAGAATETPLATQTTGDDIAKKEIKDVNDLGNTTEPGVDYVESRPGAAGGMFIRGLTGPRVATVIDDIPIPYLETLTRSGAASPTTGISDSSNSFDFSSLSALDVLRGADSSRIGSGGLGGALVMRTLEPDDLIGEGRNWGALARLGYDSKDDSFNTSVAAAYRFGSTSVLFQGAFKKGEETKNKGTDDIIGSSRTKPNPADIEQSNLLFKLRHDVEGGHRIGLTAERFSLENDTDLKTLQGATYTPGNYWGEDDTRRDRVSLDYQYEAPEAGGYVDAAKLTLYWQNLDKYAGSFGTRVAGNTPYERRNYVEESAVGLSGGLVSRFQTDGLNHTVRFGGNLNVFQYDQYLAAVPVVSSQADVPNVDGVRLGLYADDEIEVSGTGFTLTPGLRFDWHQYDPKLSDEFRDNTGFGYFGLPERTSGSRLSPKLLMEYQASQEIGLFAQWSMAYRAPTVTELYSNFTNVTGGYAVIGNPDLESETGHGFELGANYDSPSLSGRVTVFHNRYRNFINTTETFTTRFPPGYFPQFLLNSWENLERVEISGVEVRARKDFDNGFFVHGALSYAYGKDVGNDVLLRSVAPFKSVLGIGYAQEHWGAELTGIFAGGMRDDHDPTTFDAPSYGVANLTGWWEPEQFSGLRLQAGVYNIFDKTYFDALKVRDINPNSVGSTNQPIGFYSEPGRTFRVSLTQKF